MKFEEIMSGKVANPTKEQIEQALAETVSGFSQMKDLNDFLTKMHASDAYKVIRDIVQPKTNLIVRRAKDSDIKEYQRFQSIQQEAKSVFDFERKTATMFDVQQIASGIAQQFYNINVRMISTLDDELGKVEHAVNTIEEHLRLSVTKFDKEEVKHDTTESGNEQGNEEIVE